MKMEIKIIQEMVGSDLRFSIFVDGKEDTSFWLGEDVYFHREMICKYVGDAVYTILRDKGINPKKYNK